MDPTLWTEKRQDMKDEGEVYVSDIHHNFLQPPIDKKINGRVKDFHMADKSMDGCL